MLNINELEQKWLRYKIKSYIPHAIITASTLLIISIALLLLNKEEHEAINTNHLQKVSSKIDTEVAAKKKSPETLAPLFTKSNSNIVNHPIQIESTTEKKQSQNNTNTLNSKMTIAPSLDFMKKMQGNTLSNYESHRRTYPTNQTPKPTAVKTPQIPNKPKKQEIIQADPAPEKIKEQKSSISIKRQNTHDDITQVISRFNKNNNPALSLFIAKKYYELGDYHKSYNYALITNEINSDIEASWIVFAKSLVKLKEKDLAVKTLKKYISQSNSNRANMLLDEILSGKFK